MFAIYLRCTSCSDLGRERLPRHNHTSLHNNINSEPNLLFYVIRVQLPISSYMACEFLSCVYVLVTRERATVVRLNNIISGCHIYIHFAGSSQFGVAAQPRESFCRPFIIMLSYKACFVGKLYCIKLSLDSF